jgi:hypothetical protein
VVLGSALCRNLYAMKIMVRLLPDPCICQSKPHAVLRANIAVIEFHSAIHHVVGRLELLVSSDLLCGLAPAGFKHNEVLNEVENIVGLEENQDSGANGMIRVFLLVLQRPIKPAGRLLTEPRFPVILLRINVGLRIEDPEAAGDVTATEVVRLFDC